VFRVVSAELRDHPPLAIPLKAIPPPKAMLTEWLFAARESHAAIPKEHSWPRPTIPLRLTCD